MGLRFAHLADTHLGARHPGREPGDPYLENMTRALAPARRGEADLVFHAGDVFNRSRPPVRVVAERWGKIEGEPAFQGPGTYVKQGTAFVKIE